MVSQSVNPRTAPDRLIMFTRYPQAGQTKTRLIPALGAAGAADLQRQMTEHLLSQLQPFCTEKRISLQVHFAGGSKAQMSQWLGPDIPLVAQCNGHLGEKLTFALTQAFAEGTARVVVIGSDCPAISSSNIDKALQQLNSHDVAIGPAADGGYYLIALRAMCPHLFEGIPWGTDRVLAMTQAIAHQQHLSVAQLDLLTDIDRPEDLSIWAAQQAIAAPKTATHRSNQPNQSNQSNQPN